MGGTRVLLTDFDKGIPFNILEFLQEKKINPFVLIKDFESVHDVAIAFSSVIPIVLNVNQSLESTIDHLSILPNFGCIFNFEGEKFESFYHQTFNNVSKSITVSKIGFEINKIYQFMMESITEGCTLVINVVSYPYSLSSAFHGELVEHAAFHYHSTKRMHQVLEKAQKPSSDKLHQQAVTLQETNTQQQVSLYHPEMNPVGTLLRKLFVRLNPCCTTPTINFRHMNSNMPVKFQKETEVYLKTLEIQDIKSAFSTIHESAYKNWLEVCETSLKFSPELEQQFRRLCQEIERKGEEGRKILTDKINKDIERAKQWDHVLGTKTLDRIRICREKEIDKKVQQFCMRKEAEARKKVDDEINQIKIRTKGRFYREILDEQVMELMRIKDKYRQRYDIMIQCPNEPMYSLRR